MREHLDRADSADPADPADPGGIGWDGVGKHVDLLDPSAAVETLRRSV